MDDRGTRRIAHVGTGLALILAPLTFAIGFGIHPPDGDTAAAAMQSIVDNKGRWELAHILLLFAGALLLPAALGAAWSLRERPGFALIGSSLIGLGVVFFGALIGGEGITGSAIASVPPDQRLGVLPGVQAILDGRGALPIVELGLAMLAGLVVLGIGLLLTPSVPRWVGVVTIASALVMAPVASEQTEAIGALLLLIGFGYLGVRSLRAGVGGRARPAAGVDEPGIRPARA